MSAAPPLQRVGAQTRHEAGVLLRNGEQLLVSVVLPLLALVGLALAPYPELPEPRIDTIAPGVLALVVVSTAFTGQAIQTGFDRRYGVLRLLGTTPLGRAGLLAGKAVAVLLVLLLQLVAVAIIAALMGWRPAPGGIAPALVSVILGTWCFVALALVLAGTLRAEAVLALANLVWVLLAGAGGLLLAADLISPALAAVTRWLPSGALGDGLRASLLGGDIPWIEWLVLLGWAAGLSGLALRLFRWDD
ncbi:ABC transporter permease [Marihabitans asiaticum]|uniref:ABC-2 type transport system permease protein n=1 Tax=Marihabitans asiaticum TaxID=415218 RepID=A0A560WB04_9MICO|nr:ABC transporter permease [Marihabitans asiaticum]TWD14778.1 ABC-2 type transport system permease protein [Marihabitans asiaticum]